MQNKQAKLNAQERELGNQTSQELPQIFKGFSIHINGYTQPSTSELRKTILQHGGNYQHYLKKTDVTHIIASNLTNSKMQEFRAYKVVNPNWITESVKAQQLLPWQNYRLVYGTSNQKELPFKKVDNWGKQVTTSNPNFVKRYYETSRLHYLSTWKAELKEIVSKLECIYKDNNTTRKRKRSFRVIMHIDFDCFFASVSLLDRPYLKEKPVAVSHSKGINEASSSDIASCNYIARSFGVCNGMMIQKAKALCPALQIIPYEFEKYKSISEKFYQILFQYADEIEAVSVDEALIEVGSHINMLYQGEEEALALKIRDEVRLTTGCEASVGIGPNILLARMSTKKAKPANNFYCKSKEDIEELLSSQRVIDLPGVGYAIEEKLANMNVETILDLRDIPLHELKSKLGPKLGQTLYNFSRGIDDRPLAFSQERLSVSAEVNWGVRFENEEKEKAFVYDLCKEVSDRLKKCNKRGKTITVKVLKRQEGAGEPVKHLGHGQVDSFSKSYTLNDYTDQMDVINKHAYSMLKSFRFDCVDIRGFGIQITKLDNQNKTEVDQGRLKYRRLNPEDDAKPKGPTFIDRSIDKNKESMSVDPDVYSELPESVQRELSLSYHLVFHKEEIIVPTIQQDSQLPELPPWSQLDPMSLLALPGTMREQVLKAYSEKNNTSWQGGPSDDTTIKKENSAAFAQIFEPSKTIPTPITTKKPSLRVWKEIPSEICKKVYKKDEVEVDKTIPKTAL
ncbi:unnamed protein product [Rhizopus stolonifer]